ncbi:MAG: hypothetical protein JST16_06690 [Bdellovibrionales bacterium]|nr:hypothetical protein [Bdellovibrionales bacterium]
MAKITGVPNVPMDKVRWYYYFKDGYSLETERALPSFTATLAYWKPFEVKAIRRILTEFPQAILDFGAGHSYFTDSDQFDEVKSLLEPLPNVFLLLPSANKEQSLAICNQRLEARKGQALDITEIDANRNFIFHESNYKLAKHIVYTQHQTAEQVAEEIARLIE